jgi:CRP-like cAMP-binding protein
MTALAELRGHAAALLARGDASNALRIYDAIVAGAPRDFESRLKLADCLAALGHTARAIDVHRAVGWYCIRAGHPLGSVVAARVVESLGGQADDLAAALVAHYGSESELIGGLAARVAQPSGSTDVAPPERMAAPPAGWIEAAAARAIAVTEGFTDWPERLHPIPLLSQLSEAAFRRVLGTLVVRRLPDRAMVVREGEAGESFFMLATGTVRVFDLAIGGRQTELARLHGGSIFGEMALLSAKPRSASVEVVGEADLLEVTRASLAALSGELAQVAAALSAFTRDRLLDNLMATSPLFRPFSPPQRRDLLRRFTAHDVAPGTPIIRQGDDGRGLFIVLAGEVEVAADGAAGSTPLALLRAGEVFGEMALVRGGATTASVTAASQATVLFLAREYVDRVVAGIPEIRAYLEALADDRALSARLAADAASTDEDVIILI